MSKTVLTLWFEFCRCGRGVRILPRIIPEKGTFLPVYARDALVIHGCILVTTAMCQVELLPDSSTACRMGYGPFIQRFGKLEAVV
jgi:hypothetical protein